MPPPGPHGGRGYPGTGALTRTGRAAKTLASQSEGPCSKYIAASKAAQEAIYLQQILLDLGEEIVEGCVLHEDNEGCIDLGDHPSASDRTKHIDIKSSRHWQQHHPLELQFQSAKTATMFPVIASLALRPSLALYYLTLGACEAQGLNFGGVFSLDPDSGGFDAT
eukprot:2571660-Rhodomonas_salina.2